MRLTFFVWLLFPYAASAQSESEPAGPRPADIHIGHVMTAMNGTPDRVGLLEALVLEAEIAAQHAKLAASDPANLDAMQRHIRHVRHAVDPKSEDSGPGKGYGVLRASDGVSVHVKLAARSEGATDRIKTHATHVATSADNVKKWCAAIMAESEKVIAAEAPDGLEAAAEATARVAALAAQLLTGVDANEDGRVSWESDEGGIAQAKQHMEIMTQAE